MWKINHRPEVPTLKSSPGTCPEMCSRVNLGLNDLCLAKGPPWGN